MRRATKRRERRRNALMGMILSKPNTSSSDNVSSEQRLADTKSDDDGKDESDVECHDDQHQRKAQRRLCSEDDTSRQVVSRDERRYAAHESTGLYTLLRRARA